MGRLRPDEDLPPKLVERYWVNKRCADRMGYGLQQGDLLRLAVESGFGKPVEADNVGPTVADLWRKQQLAPEAPVMVQWRGKPTPGKLIRVTSSNECVVSLDGDPEERRFSVDRVSLAA